MTEENDGALAWGKLRYGKLVVTDAEGKVVPASLKIASKLAPTEVGERVLIAVNDLHAVYPLTVDPLVWIEQKVTASDGAAGDLFGISVVLDGTTALIGAVLADVGGDADQGAAYVFTNSGGSWSGVAKLTASDGVPGDHFGASVTLDGTIALVGASSADVAGNADQGAAYVFANSGGNWSEVAKLTASDGAPNDFFGRSVALDGMNALIGAYLADVGGNADQGAAYVFGNSGGAWSETQKLTASDGALNNQFGHSVALDGSTALVGAAIATVGGNFAQGAAYVFSESNGTWSESQKLTVSGGAAFDEFGHSVALDGAIALVGACGADVGGNADQGVAWVFSNSGGTWTQTAKLTGNGGAAGDCFGRSVALDGAIALVGAYHAEVAGQTDQGAAYMFTGSGGVWTQTAKLAASDGAAGDFFGGFSVALDGTSALIGAPGADIGGNSNQGAAYFFGGSDLALAVSSPAGVAQGEDFLSQAIATNSSADSSAAISVEVLVPAGAAFVSANATQGSCSEAAGVVTCDFGAISGNAGTATANVTLTATGAVGDTIVNTAEVSKTTPALGASDSTEIVANSPPVAEDGTLMTSVNTAASGSLVASDPDGDPLTFSIVAT
ncbi:MAG: hypothetical protein L0I62_10290, partial [Gammaproteobacteria bacterium]|nr:hypothetical protein [Gammaproteobacteria bacterium]